MRSSFFVGSLIAISQVAGCGEADVDALPPADAGLARDASTPDAEPPTDAGTPDLDGGVVRDAEPDTDVGPGDSGSVDTSNLRMACLELGLSAEAVADVFAEAICAYQAGLDYQDAGQAACEQRLMSCPPGEVAIDCSRVDESCDVTPAQFTTCRDDLIQQIRAFSSGLDASMSCPVLAELALQRALPSGPPPSCGVVMERCSGPFDGR